MKENFFDRESGSRFHEMLRAICLACAAFSSSVYSEPAQYPLFMGSDITVALLTMLIMGKDHTLYYEAYNDASGLSGDGVLDVGYKPNMIDTEGNQIDYFGYFDSHLCCDYSTPNNRFTLVSKTGNKKCSKLWSGDFLNYLTTTRIDALRKVLYGGKRYRDLPYDPDKSENQMTTVLERSCIRQDAHSWGKEYTNIAHDKYDIRDYAPLPLPPRDSAPLRQYHTPIPLCSIQQTRQPPMSFYNRRFFGRTTDKIKLYSAFS